MRGSKVKRLRRESIVNKVVTRPHPGRRYGGKPEFNGDPRAEQVKPRKPRAKRVAK